VHARELFDLTGRTAIVTGGAAGLGLQLAEALGEAGAQLVLCARNEDRCVEAAARFSQRGIRTVGLGCDVREPAQVQAVVDRTLSEFGQVDVVVNNAGTSWGATPEGLPLDAWRKVLEVNLTGTFLVSQAVGRAMIARGEGGKIVNLSSIAAFRGLDPAEMDSLPYNASKGGVVALTVDLAVKWARHGISVNGIAPGWFPTDMSHVVLERAQDAFTSRIPLGRLGGPDDLKGAVVFLASRASDYVTGVTLAVDGGLLATW
jgi:gluconate 5-dehydrogenase